MKTYSAVKDRRGSHGGSAVIVVIAILAILLIYTMGNVRTLDHLGKELRLLDQGQRRAWAEARIERVVVETNSNAAVKTNLNATLP